MFIFVIIIIIILKKKVSNLNTGLNKKKFLKMFKQSSLIKVLLLFYGIINLTRGYNLTDYGILMNSLSHNRLNKEFLVKTQMNIL